MSTFQSSCASSWLKRWNLPRACDRINDRNSPGFKEAGPEEKNDRESLDEAAAAEEGASSCNKLVRNSLEAWRAAGEEDSTNAGSAGRWDRCTVSPCSCCRYEMNGPLLDKAYACNNRCEATRPATVSACTDSRIDSNHAQREVRPVWRCMVASCVRWLFVRTCSSALR